MATADNIRSFCDRILQRSGAEVSQAEIDFWTAQADATGLASVRDALVSSSEATQYVDPVVRMYQAAFGRVPDAAGLNFWADELRGGGASLQDIADGFAQSPEFQARFGGGSTDEYITALYNNVLGRDPEPEGLQFWRDAVARGMSDSDLLIGFAQSPEFVERSDAAADAFLAAAGDGTATYTGPLLPPGGGGGGTDGNDSIPGSAASELLDGGAGNDTISGGGGADTILAGAGNDLVLAPEVDATADRIELGDGDDTIIGYVTGPDGDPLQGGDTLLGGAGNDVLVLDSSGDPFLGVHGVNFTEATFSGFERIVLTPGQASAPVNYILSFIDGGSVGAGQTIEIDGSALSAGETLIVDTSALAGSALVRGGAGADTVFGTDGADTILGSEGDDVFRPGRGADSIDGGAGSDTIRYLAGDSTAAATDLVTVGAGDRFVFGQFQMDLPPGSDRFQQIDIVSLAPRVAANADISGGDGLLAALGAAVTGDATTGLAYEVDVTDTSGGELSGRYIVIGTNANATVDAEDLVIRINGGAVASASDGVITFA